MEGKEVALCLKQLQDMGLNLRKVHGSIVEKDSKHVQLSLIGGSKHVTRSNKLKRKYVRIYVKQSWQRGRKGSSKLACMNSGGDR